MYLGTRKTFRKGDRAWEGYIEFIELSHLSEIRTIDVGLNGAFAESPEVYCSIETLNEALASIPSPVDRGEYCRLSLNLSEETLPDSIPGFKLLGFDLADETMTSSLLNCGPWTGLLAPLVSQLNEYGLLNLEAAQLAQQLLPQEWGAEEPHADADIWAIYERVR